MRVFRLIAKPAASPAPADSRETQARRPRVLIADDDPSVVAIVSEVLRQFEMDCDVARSGNQVLDALHRRLPDAIVLDVNMLDLDGFEVLRKIRRNSVTRDLPVLLLTGRRQQADVARGYSDGANDYMVKPFHALELANRVARLLAAQGKSRMGLAQRSVPPLLSTEV